MKRLYKAIIEEQIKSLDEVLTMLMNDMDSLVDELESLIESPTHQELLEIELEELLIGHCESTTFATEGNMTIAAVVVKESPVPLIGVAKCDPDDEFNEIVGDIIALRRALGMPVDPSQYGEPKIEKDCANCKFEDLNILQYPCNKCSESDDENPEFWESVDAPDKVSYEGPLDEDHDCTTCKHDQHTSVHQEPCRTCLESEDGRPICWEPRGVK